VNHGCPVPAFFAQSVPFSLILMVEGLLKLFRDAISAFVPFFSWFFIVLRLPRFSFLTIPFLIKNSFKLALPSFLSGLSYVSVPLSRLSQAIFNSLASFELFYDPLSSGSFPFRKALAAVVLLFATWRRYLPSAFVFFQLHSVGIPSSLV